MTTPVIALILFLVAVLHPSRKPTGENLVFCACISLVAAVLLVQLVH